MAFLLGCEKVRVEFPTKTVFTELSLGVDEGARIGIVGQNGDGKSTLLRVLAGDVEVDDGRVIRTRGVSVGVLGQTDDLRDEDTVEHAVVGDVPEYEWAGSARTRAIIAGLLGDVAWDAPVSTLSGGQRRRVDLARLLIGDWDVLMLDEPTNHLDVRAITWLADHLKTRWRPGSGALLVVTHDRWFLDEVCQAMWEVQGQRVWPFEGGFSAYIMQRVERDRLQALAEQKRQNALRRELAWLSRGARARATKPKFHVAAAQALIADVPPLRNELELKRMAMARLGKQVVDLQGATLRFGDRVILDDVDWIIGPGDRYGIVGANGIGKTTLLRIIQGLQPLDRGRVKIGQTVRFAVLSQHLGELTKLGNDRVRQVIARYSRRTMLDGKEMTPGQLLERLGFTKDDQNEPVCDLSGGQKRRLALMLILLDEPNVLILDEPGNDLDTDMLAAVESLLDGWPGTLLLVTHDRYLMERVTDHQFALIDGKVRHLPGGVDEYLRLEEEAGVARSVTINSGKDTGNSSEKGSGSTPGDASGKGSGSIPGDASGKGSGSTPGDASGKGSGSGSVGGGFSRPATPDTSRSPSVPALSGGEQRTLRKLMTSNEKKIATLKGKIEAKQLEMAAADQSDYLVLTAMQEEIADFETQIEALELEWFEAAEKLGE
ncbi:ABC-F family ATP-binding cassette domain-containing protein [Adlercreutzia sp. R7]|uniref:ABC-F family ATP-binding cassette domain-containing protein n=1 Tax=Adlercreutzia wanghongyangiae TaxID=3111451 RepID=A0ABU6II08_9ACTN|nr:ABC-F family ATP-binding cassette domain-containing protein [Adlercreutzia sp. R7]